MTRGTCGLPSAEPFAYYDRGSARLRMLGNAVVWPQAAHAIRLLTQPGAEEPGTLTEGQETCAP